MDDASLHDLLSALPGTLPLEVLRLILRCMVPCEQEVDISTSEGQVQYSIRIPKNLLLIDKASKEECITIFFETNTFVFIDRCSLIEFVHWNHPPANASIKHIQFSETILTSEIIAPWEPADALGDHQRSWEAAIGSLINFPKLETLRILDIGFGPCVEFDKDPTEYHFDRKILHTILNTPGPMNQANMYCSERRHGTTLVKSGTPYEPRSTESFCTWAEFSDRWVPLRLVLQQFAQTGHGTA